MFTWETPYHTDQQFDRVQFAYAVETTEESPWYCGGPLEDPVTLSGETEDVQLPYPIYHSSGEYIHTLQWNGRCCYPGTPKPYKFRVYSGFEEPTANDWSAWQTFNMKVCAQQQ